MKKITVFIMALIAACMLAGCAGATDKSIAAYGNATAAMTETAADGAIEAGTDKDTLETTTTETPSEPSAAEPTDPESTASGGGSSIDEDGNYTEKDDVALYIHTYGKLPSNFITKKEAQALGWEGGSLETYAPGKSIGGDRFGNYEGLLPKKDGRTYTECDIDTLGKNSRGAKRIVFSNDGLIYYTDDHYESFTLLYGEE